MSRELGFWNWVDVGLRMFIYAVTCINFFFWIRHVSNITVAARYGKRIICFDWLMIYVCIRVYISMALSIRQHVCGLLINCPLPSMAVFRLSARHDMPSIWSSVLSIQSYHKKPPPPPFFCAKSRSCHKKSINHRVMCKRRTNRRWNNAVVQQRA